MQPVGESKMLSGFTECQWKHLDREERAQREVKGCSSRQEVQMRLEETAMWHCFIDLWGGRHTSQLAKKCPKVENFSHEHFLLLHPLINPTQITPSLFFTLLCPYRASSAVYLSTAFMFLKSNHFYLWSEAARWIFYTQTSCSVCLFPISASQCYCLFRSVKIQSQSHDTPQQTLQPTLEKNTQIQKLLCSIRKRVSARWTPKCVQEQLQVNLWYFRCYYRQGSGFVVAAMFLPLLILIIMLQDITDSFYFSKVTFFSSFIAFIS